MLKRIFIDNRELAVLVALSLFLITLPISYGLNSVSAIIIGALFIFDTPSEIRRKINSLKKNKLFLRFLIFFLIQVVGLLYTQNLKSGIKELIQLLPFISIPITLLSERLNVQKTLKILYWFRYYLFTIVGLLLAYQFLKYGNLLSFEHDTFLKLKISTFYFSAILFITIITTLFELKKNQFKGVWDYFFITFFSWVLLLLGARIAILILFICFVIFLFNSFPKIFFYKKLLFTLVFSFCFFFIAYQVPQVKKKIDISLRTMDFDFKTILTKNQISNTRNSIEYRVLINYCSYNVLKNNIFGVGLGDNRDELIKEYYKINFRAGIKEKFNCHNQYMEEFTKQGVVGGVFFISLIFFLLKKGLKTKRRFFYTGLYIALVCMVESYFYRQHGVMFAAFFLPLFYSLEKLNDAK